LMRPAICAYNGVELRGSMRSNTLFWGLGCVLLS
jgi:hypothetical protein